MYDDIYTNLSDSLTNFANAQQLQTELAFQPLNDLSVSMQESIYNISSNLDKIISTDWANQFSAAYDFISQAQIYETDWINQLSAIYDSMPAAVKIPTIEFPFDGLSFLKDIDFQQDYIDLTENDCDSINAILRPSDTSEDAPLKVSKGKMAVSDFIKTILFPLFLALLQMLHTSYYNKLEAIDSQKVYMEEHQLKEEEIQLLKEQIQLQQQEIQNISDYATSLENTLNELIGYVSSQEYLQGTLKSDSVLPNSSVLPDEDPESLDEVPDCFDEAPNSSDAIDDESDNL